MSEATVIYRWSNEYYAVYIELQTSINTYKKLLAECNEEFRKKSFISIINELTKIRDEWKKSVSICEDIYEEGTSL